MTATIGETRNVNSYIALFFDAGTSVDSLEGFFLRHTSMAGIEEKNNGIHAIYLPSEEWTNTVQKSLSQFITENPEVEFLGSEEIAERNWNAEWEASVLPERATQDLIITPSWHLDQARAMASKYVLIIDPKMSFGTGHHETTRLCLQAIEKLDVVGKHVLDLGTGTGVLAMYALLRGAEDAVGIDTDHWSIENATENRELNELAPGKFELRSGTLETASKPEERFDVILANIHRNILLESAASIREHCSAGAKIVLSGILMYDIAEIRGTYEAHGFRFVHEWKENEWACLLFEFADPWPEAAA